MATHFVLKKQFWSLNFVTKQILLFMRMTHVSAMQRSLVGNIRWKTLGMLFTVWIVILACEIGKVGI